MELKKFASWFGTSRATEAETVHSLKRELEGQLSALHNAAIVSETDVKGNITFVNDTFCEISGYTREELMGQNHRILKSGHQPDEIFREMWRTIARGKMWQGQVKNKCKDGTYYWVWATITPILDADTGKPVKYVSVRFDITAQKEQEERLHQQMEEIQSQDEEIRQTLEELQAVSDNLYTAQRELNYRIAALNNAAIVSETDARGNILYANDLFCEISQFSREELIGQNHRILRHPDMPAETFKDLWQTIVAGNVWRGVIKNRKKDGSPYWVHSTITPVLGDNGKPDRYIAVRVDITSEREKDRLISESNQSIEELNASLALAKDMLEKKLAAKTHELHDSVIYAQRLQRAILTPIPDFKRVLPTGYELEVLFQPKDVVSGDFYWGGRWKNKGVIMMGDGTGHGVPGAFLTLLGLTNLCKLVEERGITEPSNLLEELDTEIRKILNQDRDDVELNMLDSLEGTVLTFTDNRPEFLASSAMRPMVLVKASGEVLEQPGAKKCVGGRDILGQQHFETISIHLEPGETLYLFSDGYQDQIGGPGDANKKFGKSAFLELLGQLASVERLRDRNKILYKKHEDWKGFFRDQTDDITVLMLRREA